MAAAADADADDDDDDDDDGGGQDSDAQDAGEIYGLMNGPVLTAAAMKER